MLKMKELSFSEVNVVSGGNGDHQYMSMAYAAERYQAQKSLLGSAVRVVGTVARDWAIGKAIDTAYDAVSGYLSSSANGNSGGTGGARSDNRGSTGTDGTSNGDGHGF
jgi:hypothetical protein